MKIKLTIFVILYFFSSSSYAQVNEKLDCVVIDAGHGGKDPGTIGTKGTKEKDIALKIALGLGQKIKQHYPSVKIIYTREKDEFVALHQRAKIANDQNADLFISIHLNANEKTSFKGIETYVMSTQEKTTAENLKVCLRENSVIDLEENKEFKYSSKTDNDAAFIIQNTQQDFSIRQSYQMAGIINKEICGKTKLSCGEVKMGNFHVLRMTTMPSVLVEVAYLSNKDDEQYVIQDSAQIQIIDALFDAFATYKKYYEKSNENSKLVDLNQTTDESEKAMLISTRSVPPAPIPQFYIQVASCSKKAESNSPLLKIQNIKEVQLDNSYKYLVPAASYQEAIKMLKEFKINSFHDVFIIALLNEKKIQLSEALNLINKP